MTTDWKKKIREIKARDKKLMQHLKDAGLYEDATHEMTQRQSDYHDGFIDGAHWQYENLDDRTLKKILDTYRKDNWQHLTDGWTDADYIKHIKEELNK